MTVHFTHNNSENLIISAVLCARSHRCWIIQRLLDYQKAHRIIPWELPQIEYGSIGKVIEPIDRPRGPQHSGISYTLIEISSEIPKSYEIL